MADTGYNAVAKVAMHGREHIVIIRPTEDGLALYTMYFANELHKRNRVSGAASGKFAAKEMYLAKRLIDTLASPFKREQYEDEYRKKSSGSSKNVQLQRQSPASALADGVPFVRCVRHER